MAILSLILALSILALLTVIGVLILTQRRFREMEKRLVSLDRDLRQFYRDLGRPKAEIINIQGRKRPS